MTVHHSWCTVPVCGLDEQVKQSSLIWILNPVNSVRFGWQPPSLPTGYNRVSTVGVFRLTQAAETQGDEATLRLAVERCCLALATSSRSVPGGRSSSQVVEAVENLKSTLKRQNDVDLIRQCADELASGKQWLPAEICLERTCVILGRTKTNSDPYFESLLQLAFVYAKQGKVEDAREARRALVTAWTQSCTDKNELGGKLFELAEICEAENDFSEAESYCRTALKILQSCDGAEQESSVECMRLLQHLALRQHKTMEAQAIEHHLNDLLTTGQVDEIDRALRSYIALPDKVDLRLHLDGIDVHTDDFPKLILESCGLDLRQYFIDCFKNADFLKEGEKEKLAFDLFRVFRTVDAFISGTEGATMERSEVTIIEIPRAMSQGFVQTMTVERKISFRLTSAGPDDATFESLSGITFNVGGKIIALNQFNLKALDGRCIVTPTLDVQGNIQTSGTAMSKVLTAGKDMLVSVFTRLSKVGRISTELPCIRDEFRTYLADALRFKELLRNEQKDLVMFIETNAHLVVEDPLTLALLSTGMRVSKNGDAIELERNTESVCDLGGVVLKIAPSLKLKLLRKREELNFASINGVGMQVLFDQPPELQQIGLDLKRSLPTQVCNLTLGQRDEIGKRRIIVGTAPGCWIGLDLNTKMQPTVDQAGNWMVFGVTHNPISGVPQQFFLRLDTENNLDMTPREIASLATQTAFEGFDPTNPMTWKWGAIALAGSLATSVTDDDEELEKGARHLGRIIGWLLKEL